MVTMRWTMVAVVAPMKPSNFNMSMSEARDPSAAPNGQLGRCYGRTRRGGRAAGAIGAKRTPLRDVLIARREILASQ